LNNANTFFIDLTVSARSHPKVSYTSDAHDL